MWSIRMFAALFALFESIKPIFEYPKIGYVQLNETFSLDLALLFFKSLIGGFFTNLPVRGTSKLLLTPDMGLEPPPTGGLKS